MAKPNDDKSESLSILEDQESVMQPPQPPVRLTGRGADQYRALFENNLDAVFSLDRQGRFTEINSAAERLSGYTIEDLAERTLADFCAPEDRHKAMFFFARAMGGAPRSVELTMVCANGDCVDLYLTGAPIVSDASITGLFCIAHDITRRRRAEDQLRKARKDAEQAKERFLADVSHELRTPLMPVLTTVQLLEQRRELPADVQECLAMMRRNLELEASLIDDLLDLSRIRQGRLTLNLLSVDLHCKVQHVIKQSDDEISAKNLKITTNLEATDSRLAGDPSRIHQILWNVINNAVKFTPHGGSIQITTCNGTEPDSGCRGNVHGNRVCKTCGSFRKGRFIAIHIRDTGVGIASERLERLFEAFGRGDYIRERGHGRGVGLAITRALVELHGGRMVVQSEGRGKGTTFSIVLPLRNPRQLPGESSALSDRPQPTTRTRNVLLVEDHSDTAKALSRLLSDTGLKVTVATSVQSAVSLLRGETFDLLISDIGLPDGTGHDVVRQVREAQDIPAIALSGYGMEDDIRRSHEAGFSEHLVKPINIVQLQQTIRRLLSAP